MILLDTEMVSDPWKPQPDPQMVAWLDAQKIEILYLASVTVAELRFGLTGLPEGERRKMLHERLEQKLLEACGPCLVPFKGEVSRIMRK